MDRLTHKQRHYNMSQIRSKDTCPEIMVRRYLFSKGLRYRKNDKKLPGHPDIVLPKYRTVIFVNGCFWHGHENCEYFRLPQTNTSFWEEKIARNKKRDMITNEKLIKDGWKTITIWECELKKAEQQKTFENLLQEIYNH